MDGQVKLVAYLENAENRGIPEANNQGLAWIAAHDEGPYGVVFLSADTEVKAVGWLGRILAFAEEHPEAGVIGGARSPNGPALPVYHNQNGRWYQHDKMSGGVYQGESVDFSCAFLRPELLARGLRFDTRYIIYDGYDQDLCFRVRSWGYQVVQIDAGVIHYGSAAMKKAGYRWRGGGRTEWDALRARNLARLVRIWGAFLAPRRKSISQEMAHMETMNRRLVAEAGDRKAVPTIADYRSVPGAAITPAEREWLRETADLAEARFGMPTIVNVGVMWGCSLHCLRAGSALARLVGVDLDYEHNRLVGDPGAELIEGDSSRVGRDFDGPVHLLFIDGDHRHQGVKADIESWISKVAVGGIIAFHDYAPRPEHLVGRPDIEGVRRAVDEWFAGVGRGWEEVRSADSIRAFRRVNG